MKNIEFKTRVSSFREVAHLLQRSGAKPEGVLKQVDTYYECPSGKLKLRVIDRRECVLIAYHRPARRGSRTSTYTILTLERPQARSLASMLARTLGIRTSVRKTRILWIHGITRIHLDTVTSLGRFVELETVVRGMSLERARRKHRHVLSLLHLESAVPIAGSYGDMMLTCCAPRARSGQRGSERNGNAGRRAPAPDRPGEGVGPPVGPLLRRAGLRSTPNATSSGVRIRTSR
jgi:adenylate cyclase class IV